MWYNLLRFLACPVLYCIMCFMSVTSRTTKYGAKLETMHADVARPINICYHPSETKRTRAITQHTILFGNRNESRQLGTSTVKRKWQITGIVPASQTSLFPRESKITVDICTQVILFTFWTNHIVLISLCLNTIKRLRNTNFYKNTLYLISVLTQTFI